MQETYFSIMLGKTPPREVFAEFRNLLARLSAEDKAKVAAQVPAVLMRCSTASENALVYLELVGEVFGFLDVQQKLLLCYHAFTTIPFDIYGEPKWKSVISFLLEFASTNFRLIPKESFFSQDFLMATIRQGCFMLGFLIKSGVDLLCDSEECTVPIRCLAAVLNCRECKSFPANVVNVNSSIENWLGYLILIMKLKEEIYNPVVKKRLNTILPMEVKNYMQNIVPLNADKCVEDKRLLTYTNHVITEVLTGESEDAVKSSIMKKYVTYFPKERQSNFKANADLSVSSSEVSSIAFSGPDNDKARQELMSDDSKDDLESFFKELNVNTNGEHEERKRVNGRSDACIEDSLPEANVEASKFCLSQVSTAPKSKSTLCYTEFQIGFNGEALKSLSQVDRRFLRGECTLFIHKFIADQTNATLPSCNVFHNHFKHQYSSKHVDSRSRCSSGAKSDTSPPSRCSPSPIPPATSSPRARKWSCAFA